MDMKTIFGYIAAALLVAGVSVACDNKEPLKQEPVKISLQVSPIELNVTAARSIETIEVITNAEEWDFMTTASWIEVEKTEDGLTVEVLENEKTEVRTADIIVFAFTGDVRETATVTVEQAAAVSEGGNEGGSDIGGLDANGNIVFECSEFKAQMVTYYDANGDGEISPAEVANVKDLVVTYDEENEEIFQITSLVGIKYFVNLVNLDCDLNLLTSLDLSGLKKLEYVDCCYNKITDLNLSGCESLKWIYFYSNAVTEINLDGCKNLTFIQGYKNKISKMDVRGLQELVYFDMRFNSLTELKISNCPKLNIIATGDNYLTSLELAGLPELYTVGCYNNNISTLDVSNLPKLQMLECYNNNLAKLDVSANPLLTMLTCQNNMISELDFEGCNSLKVLSCSSNRLSGDFNLSAYKDLERVDCGGNNFTSVNVTGCTKISDLSCANTDITTLDVTSNTLLESLICNDCLLTTLDVSANRRLKKLYANGNPLESLYMAEGQVINDLKLDNHDVIIRK